MARVLTARHQEAKRHEQASGGLLVAVRHLVLGALALGVVGVAGAWLSWPLLTATLGPTLYVLLAHPDSEGARMRNALVGHGAGIVMGLLCLTAFGLLHTRAVPVEGAPGIRQAGAAAVALGLTLLALDLLDAHHAPAAATTLLVATGIARPGKPLLGLLIGLAAALLLGPVLAQLPFRRDQAAREP